MAFLRLTTPDGHNMAEVYSCFQKFVRRGDLAEALYWGHEIAATRGEYKGYPNALKKRLLQHALEDVGHLDYALALLAAEKKPTWGSLRPWIRVLCEMPKTRGAAWFNRIAVEHVRNPEGAPTTALQRGAAALVAHRDEDGGYLAEHFPKDVLRLYKEINNEVLALHTYILKDEGIIEHVRLPFPLPAAPVFEWKGKHEVPDWCLDKHTSRGKRLGRGYAHFFETMVVAPRLMRGELDLFEGEARELYLSGSEQRVRHILENSKHAPAPAPVPAPAPAPPVPAPAPAHYTNTLQAQLLTGRHKPRVWFATDSRTGQQVVLKGPVKGPEIEAVVTSEELKARLGLPNTFLRAEQGMLVWRSLIDYTTLETHIVSSKLETDVRVPVAKGICRWCNDMLEDNELALGLMEALLFRKMVGTNDTCHRNIMVVDRRVYTIDDAAYKKETPLMWKMPMRAAVYNAALERVWTTLNVTMERWKPLIAEDPFASNMLRTLSSSPSAWKWED
jgi:hypothetical protein